MPSIKILALQESRELKHVPYFRGYHPIYWKERKDRVGGGVAFLVSSDIKFTKIESPFDNVETLAIDCEYRGKTYRIINLYKPPRVPHAEYYDFLKRLPIRTSDRELVILGDFNLDSNKGEDEETSLYFAEHGLGNIIDIPTRAGETSQTIIDHCYTRVKHARGVVFVTDELADHWPIALELGRKEKRP